MTIETALQLPHTRHPVELPGEHERAVGQPLVLLEVEDGFPRIRLTWILDDAEHARWRNEYTLDGLTWARIEEYAMVAAGERP